MDKTLQILLLVSSLLSFSFPPFFFSETARSEKISGQLASSVAVLIEATPSGSVPNQEVGYCQTGRSTVTFTNQGLANDPAMSTITDLSLGIALGDAFSLQNNGYSISSVSIAGVALNAFGPLNSLSDHPQFSTDPDGAGGLIDADNDGFFDDLGMGGSVEVTIQYEFDCSQTNNTDPTTNCLNNSSTSLNARFQYVHNGQQSLFKLDKYLRPANESIEFETFSDPDAFAGVDTFTVVQTIIRRIRSFKSTCNGSGEFRATIELPNAVEPITDRFRLVKNGLDEVPILDAQVTAAEMNFTFDASFSDIIAGEYALEMVFTSTCFPLLGPSVFPVTFSHFCPTCSCEHIWFCGDVAGPHFHTIAPPCPNELLWDCSAGLLAHSFDVDRISFGFSDEDFTVPFDPVLANKKVGMPCDKVAMTFTSTVGAAPIADSIGVVINYGTPFNAVSTQELFLFESGSLRIRNNGSPIDCPITDDMISVEQNGPEKTVYFDLHSCLSSLGITLLEGDSVNLSAIYSINPAAPISSEFAPIPNFRAYAYHEVDGVRQSCDNFGEVFHVGRSRAIYDFPNTLAGMPNGCNKGELNFRLFVPENKFSRFFGNELRQAQKIDSFVLDFDPLLLDAYGTTNVMVSIPGHPVHGGNYFPIKPLSDFPSGHYVASFDTLDHVPSLNMVEQYSFDLQLDLVPNCLAGANTKLDFQSKIFYNDRFYASSIDNGDCVNKLSAVGNNSVFYTSPVKLDLLPTAPISATVSMGEAEWTVQVCNNSTADAGTVWVAIEDGANVLNVLSLENIDIPLNPIALTLAPYGVNHHFAVLNGLAAGQCTELKLTANAVGCQDLDFHFIAGWDCSPLDLSNWTPENNTCVESLLKLNMVNPGTSPVSLEIDSWTSECSETGINTFGFLGFLRALTNVPTDNFTLIFTQDENGNGMADTMETVVHQVSFLGAVTTNNPLVLNTSFMAPIAQGCNLIVSISANNTNLCSGIEMPMPVAQLLNAGQDQFFCKLVGGNIVTTIGTSSCDATDYSYQWSAVPPADLTFLDDATSPNPSLTFDPSGFLGDTVVYVLETQHLACSAVTNDTVRIILPNTTNGFFQNDTVQVQSTDCALGTDFCLGIPVASLSQFIIERNGSIFPNGNTKLCNGTQVAVPLPTGFNTLVLNNIVSGCSNSVVVNVSCTQTEEIELLLQISSSDTVCLSADELGGPIQSVTNLCLNGAFADYQVLDDTCVVVTGLLAGEEIACFIACDAGGFCDTTILNITVSHPYGDGLNDTIVVSQNSHFCFNENFLNILGGVETFENVCESQSGTSVVFNLDPINSCVFYDGIGIGTDAACLSFCNNNGQCDTILYSVTVVPGNIEMDTVFVNVDTNLFCVDPQLLPGNIVSVSDYCPENNGDEVIFTFNGNCVSYYGDILGTDTACVRIEDEFGNVALINLQVTVVKTTPETVCDTVFIRELVEYCLDTSDLPGIYQTFNILYDNSSVENVDFQFDPVELCVAYEGVALGQDSFSIELCDHFGFCDTTSFCLTVEPYFDPPIANHDYDTTLKETPVVVDPLSNDTVFGGLVSFTIIAPPISGEARINLEGSITYIPFAPFCDRDDQFTYVICNPNGCDTATVFIHIKCIDLTVFNAVSPNNDGLNDYFYIAKIESFPENKIWIYNRWGNQVFFKTGYDNSWPGTWGNDIDLPDGTYYYIFEWMDDGEVNRLRGYFEMYR